MKTAELFCASPASTAICSSTDQRTMVRRGLIERHHHHHRLGGGSSDNKRPKQPKTTPLVPCSSHIPISPRPYFEKSRKNPSKENEWPRRKSSADVADLSSCTPRSSRYLLSDNPIFQFFSESENSSSSSAAALIPSRDVKIKQLKYCDDYPMLRSSSARSHESPVYQLPASSTHGSNVHDFHAYKSHPLQLPAHESNAQKALPAPPSAMDSSHAKKSLSVCKQDSRADKSSLTRSREQVNSFALFKPLEKNVYKTKLI